MQLLSQDSHLESTQGESSKQKDTVIHIPIHTSPLKWLALSLAEATFCLRDSIYQGKTIATLTADDGMQRKVRRPEIGLVSWAVLTHV